MMWQAESTADRRGGCLKTTGVVMGWCHPAVAGLGRRGGDLITDLPSAADLVTRLAAEAEDALGRASLGTHT